MLIHSQQVMPYPGVEAFSPVLRPPEDDFTHLPRQKRSRSPAREVRQSLERRSYIYRHQLVFQRNDCFTAPGISLPAAATKKLPVDAPGFVPFRGDDVQPAQVANPWSQTDIRSSARHVGRYSNLTLFARAADDLGLFLILTGIQNPVGQTGIFEPAA